MTKKITVKRRPRILKDCSGRFRRDYPCEVTVNLSEKQMAFVREVCAMWGSPEYFIYHLTVEAIEARWNSIPKERRDEIIAMK